MMNVLVVGNIAFDMICRVRRLPKQNEATSIDIMKRCFGGCAGNAAVVLKNLGIDVSIFSSVGVDFGKSDYERKFLDLGIDTSNLQYNDDMTSRSFMFSDIEGNQQIYYYPGSSSKLRYRKIDFSKYRFVHFTAGEMSVYRRLMEDAKRYHSTISFDPGQEIFHRKIESVMDCLKYSDYLFFNEFESKHIVKELKLNGIEDLLSENTKAVIVSKGEKGSRIYMKNRVEDIPAIRVKNVSDPTGAGDSHRAGFLAGIIKGYDEITACRIGSIVSHFIIQGIGAQKNVPSWEDVTAKYIEIFGEAP